MFVRFISCVSLALLTAAGSATPAVDPAANFTVNRIRNATPPCGPGAGPVVGRVTGVIGFGSSGGRQAGFVGCFDSASECNFWRTRVLGAIDGRIISNRCEAGR